jgi:hypothetical protein
MKYHILAVSVALLLGFIAVIGFSLIYSLFNTKLKSNGVKNVTVRDNSPPIGKIHYITFADGFQFNKNANENIDIYKKWDIFDTFTVYSLDDIDIDFKENNKEILEEKHGCGLWIWKPYLIKKKWMEIDDQDIIVYMDAGRIFKKPPNHFIQRVHGTKTSFLSYTEGIALATQTKGDLFFYTRTNEKIKYNSVLWAGGMMIQKRKDSISENLLNEWLRICQIPEAITNCTSKRRNPKEFTLNEFNYDQSIYSLLGWKYGVDTVDTEEVYEHIGMTDRGSRYINKKNVYELYLRVKNGFNSKVDI